MICIDTHQTSYVPNGPYKRADDVSRHSEVCVVAILCGFLVSGGYVECKGLPLATGEGLLK